MVTVTPQRKSPNHFHNFTGLMSDQFDTLLGDLRSAGKGEEPTWAAASPPSGSSLLAGPAGAVVDGAIADPGWIYRAGSGSVGAVLSLIAAHEYNGSPLLDRLA